MNLKTILIMDPSQDVRTQLFMGIPLKGYEEKPVPNAPRMLLETDMQEFDLVILGPGILEDPSLEIILSGIRRTKNAQTPILLATRRSDKDAAMEAFGYGVDHTFPIEPFNIDEVRKAIRKWTGKKIVDPLDAWEKNLSEADRNVLAAASEKLCPDEIRSLKSSIAALDAVFTAARAGLPLAYTLIMKHWQPMYFASLSEPIMTFLRQMGGDDQELMLHSLRVALYADTIARMKGFKRGARTFLWVGGIGHDIGRVLIPPKILRVEGPLSERQRDQLNQHPLYSERVLGEAAPLMVRQAAAQHHERIDGSGYPKGLKDADISLIARIIAVADACDGLVSSRPHRPIPPPKEEVVRILANPGHFDQEVVRILCEINKWEYLTPD